MSAGLIIKRVLFIASGIIIVFLLLAREYASRVGEELYSCLSGCAKEITVDDQAIRLVTLNLYHGYPDFQNLLDRLDLVATRLDRLQADIVFLQEVPWRKETGPGAEYLGRKAGFNYVYIRANGNFPLIRFEEGLAVLSRYPLSDPEFTELLPQPGFFEHRVLLKVSVDTHAGPVTLVTTHLARRRDEQSNAAQASTLEAYVNSITPGPVIVAGDFNALETSPQIQRLAATWRDAYREFNPGNAGYTCCLSRNALDQADAGTPFVRLDYIFLGPGRKSWEIINASTVFDQPEKNRGVSQWASNHIGVMVDIIPPGSVSTGGEE